MRGEAGTEPASRVARDKQSVGDVVQTDWGKKCGGWLMLLFDVAAAGD